MICLRLLDLSRRGSPGGPEADGWLRDASVQKVTSVKKRKEGKRKKKGAISRFPRRDATFSLFMHRVA